MFSWYTFQGISMAKKKTIKVKKAKGTSVNNISVISDSTSDKKKMNFQKFEAISDSFEEQEDVISNNRLKSLFSNQKSTTTSDEVKQKSSERNNIKLTQKSIINRRKRKKILKYIGFTVLFIFSFLAVLTYFFIVEPALKIKTSVNNVEGIVKELAFDFQSKDLTNIDSKFERIDNELNLIEKEIDQYKFLSNLSVTKGYYNNLQVFKNVATKSRALTVQTLPELKEVLEITGFKVSSESTSKSNDDEESAFTLLLNELPLYLALYQKSEPKILEIFNEVNKIDPTYLPSFLNLDLADNLKEFKKFSQEFPKVSSEIVNFVRFLPELIGSKEPTTYLLILQNETEMRASGGLITAYGTMTIKNGEFDEEITLADSWNLELFVSGLGIDVGFRNIFGQNVLMNNGCGSTYLRAQDSGIYPDLKWSMETFSKYYYWANYYNPTKFPAYDHVLILNNKFAETILSLIQPLEVEGYGEVTAENLFEFIKEETDKPELSYSSERKKIIKDIANAAKEKFLDLPAEQLPALGKSLINSFYAKDWALHSSKPEIQTFFDQYELSGTIAQQFDGDYFHLNEAQNCSLKLNKWVRNTVNQEITILDDGSISKSVNIKWEQPQIYTPGLKLQYSPEGRFSYRAWVRLFTPVDSTSFETDGYRSSAFIGYIPQLYYDEIVNKTVSDNIIQFDHRRFTETDPIPTRELNITYTLPESLNYHIKKDYRMLIQKHPGKSWGEKYNLTFNYKGQTYTETLTLDQDKIVRFKDGIISVTNYHTKLIWLEELLDNLKLKNNE